MKRIEKYVNFEEKYDDCDEKRLKTGLSFIYLVKLDLLTILYRIIKKEMKVFKVKISVVSTYDRKYR